MLPKINRLKKEKDFERVFKLGRGAKEDFLFLKFLPNNSKESRFGFVVSDKVSKKATVRNKLKRRLREIIFSKLSQIEKSFDFVFITRPGLEKKDFSELEKTTEKILRKGGLIK